MHCIVHLHTIMGHQQLLQLIWIKVEVLVLDQLFEPAIKVEVASFIIVAEVSGVKEAVVAKEPFVFLRVVEIAEHGVVRLVSDLANHMWTNCHTSVWVNDLDSFCPEQKLIAVFVGY